MCDTVVINIMCDTVVINIMCDTVVINIRKKIKQFIIQEHS